MTKGSAGGPGIFGRILARVRAFYPTDPALRGKLVRHVAATLVGLGVLLVAAAVVVYESAKPHNVSNPKVAFQAPTTTTTTTPKKVAVNNFSWPLYGYTLARTRDFSSEGANLKPPFRVAWSHGGNALLEFPPSIYGDYLYYLDDGATIKKVATGNGHQEWMTHLGTLSAASPALDPQDQLLFVPTLSDTGRSPGNGRFAAVSMRTGKVVWSIPISSGTESSPLYRDGIVYFGSQSGTVYAVHAKTGRTLWTYSASGSVKGGPAYDNGLLFFGDYAGKVYAVHAATGKLDWEAGSGSGAFGYGAGTFYGTPAVAYGRVYIGNTNGQVYSFSESTGEVGWSIGTGAYVYSAAAVADIAGVGPTVFIGSYNGDFYALNAQTGAARWVHSDGYHISGSSTVIGNVVYYSDFGHWTTGLNVKSGAVVFRYNDGAYTPMVATPDALYLSGNYVLYKLVDKRTAKR